MCALIHIPFPHIHTLHIQNHIFPCLSIICANKSLWTIIIPWTRFLSRWERPSGRPCDHLPCQQEPGGFLRPRAHHLSALPDPNPKVSLHLSKCQGHAWIIWCFLQNKIYKQTSVQCKQILIVIIRTQSMLCVPFSGDRKKMKMKQFRMFDFRQKLLCWQNKKKKCLMLVFL